MIVGITGTNGAGKGTVVDYLEKEKGFTHFSARALLIEEIKKQGLPIDRTHMRHVANELRKEKGPAHVAIELMQHALKCSGNAVVESIRTVGEADYIRSHGALLWAVDADMDLRYERILGRMSETDAVTFEHFKEFQHKELHGTDHWDMNVFAVMKKADHIFLNNGTVEELLAQVEIAISSEAIA